MALPTYTSSLPTKVRSRANVLGVGVDAINMDSAIGRLRQAIEGGEKGYVCVTGVHGVMEAQHDAEFKRILNESLLTTPDGMPMVWVGRSQGNRAMDRVYGPDLMLELCRVSEREGYTHFLYGGADGVASQLSASLQERFPRLRIVGTYTPPFRPLTPDEELALASQIAAVRPDVLWVGLSTPKQERFMSKHLGQLDATVMIGVGAAFDMHSGRTKQAPRWMQRSGLEWLYRLLQEPRRLFRRYAVNNPAFIYRMLLQSTGFVTYRLD